MPYNLTEGLTLLERTPKTLRALLAGLPQAWLESNEGPQTFSPRDVLGHLVHGEKTDWVARARIILDEGPSRTFDSFDRFAFRSRDPGEPVEALLNEFEQLRRENLDQVRKWKLSAAQMELGGMHPELGPVTLSQLLATWVVHDLGHVRQIMRVMAKRLDSEVGPWREYLRILHE